MRSPTQKSDRPLKNFACSKDFSLTNPSPTQGTHVVRVSFRVKQLTLIPTVETRFLGFVFPAIAHKNSYSVGCVSGELIFAEACPREACPREACPREACPREACPREGGGRGAGGGGRGSSKLYSPRNAPKQGLFLAILVPCGGILAGVYYFGK